MSLYFNFTDEELNGSTETKPVAIANQPFQYSGMDDRRFESLSYFVFKKKIEYEPGFRERHDSIQLMQGVGEKGRDCALYKEKSFSGLVQCKNYKTAIDETSCLQEIIKPVLHVIVGNLTIRHPESFEYYFVAANGFSGNANEMLADFPSFVDKNIVKIQKAVTKLKKAYAAFSSIDFSAVQSQLIHLLKSIEIIQFSGQDLDNELLSPGSESIIANFFSVRTVVDTDAIEKLREELSERKNISVDLVKARFETASLQLSQYPNTLEGLHDSHIKRNETAAIIAWINEPLSDKAEPILLVVGEPGGGKTVILRDVFDELRQGGLFVVAFKADRYKVSSLTQLQDVANLPDSLEDCVRALARDVQPVVVIIDQIDAVSQSVTSERSCVDTYSQLIHTLKNITGVRIIVSIRRFELEYDYEFSEFKHKLRQIKVQPLSRSEVITVISRLGMTEKMLSEDLYKLISTPNHLNIFCKIKKSGASYPALITTVQGLYGELWRQKIEGYSGNIDEIETALFNLAEQMHLSRGLTVPEKPFLATGPGQYLKRVELITQANGYVQFFHQTFFDYAFARSFTKKGQSLTAYLKNERQSLYSRASVKMILGFVREESHAEYVDLIQGLLFARWVRWHIKSLVLTLLAYEDAPSNYEIKLVRQKILKKPAYAIPFVEAIRGRKWLTVLIEDNIMDLLLYPTPTLSENIRSSRLFAWLKRQRIIPNRSNWEDFSKRKDRLLNAWWNLIRTNMNSNSQLTLTYLYGLGEIDNKSAIVLRLMIGLVTWDSELSKDVYLKNADAVNDLSLKLGLLENAVEYHASWAIGQLEKEVLSAYRENHLRGDSMFDYHVEEIAQKLVHKCPEDYFQFCLRVIRTFIDEEPEESKYQEGELVRDSVFTFFEYESSGHDHGKDWFLRSALETAQMLSKNKSIAFRSFLETMVDEKSITIISIAFAGLLAAPENFHNEGYALLEVIAARGGFSSGTLNYQICNLLPQLFPLLQPLQKRHLAEKILRIKNESEIGSYHDQNGKLRFYSSYGRSMYQLIASIPETERKLIPDLKRKYAELERKFGQAENKPPHRFVVHGVSAPLSAKAYEKMGLNDWEASFRHYDENYQPSWQSFKGGLLQHYRAFEEQVSSRPDFFLPLLRKIVEENTVHPDYQIAGLEGLKKAAYNPGKFLELYKKVMVRPHDAFGSRTIIWLSEYLARTQNIDQEVFDFLYQKVIISPEEEQQVNTDHPHHDALNTVRGVAVHVLMLCNYNEKYTILIFDALEKLAETASQSVRISALFHLAYYIRFNAARTTKIFCQLIKPGDHYEVYQAGMYSAQYLAKRDFARVLPFLKNAMAHNPCQRNTSTILALAWMSNKPGSMKLLKEAWKKYPEARAAMIDVAVANFVSDDADLSKKSKWLFNRFLSDTSDEVVHEYRTTFLHLKKQDFHQLLPLLTNYSRSVVARKGPGYYFDYLQKNCRIYPKECIDLLQPAVQYDSVNITKSNYYDTDKPTKVLVGAYNSLNTENAKDKRYLKKGLTLFDTFLKHPVFRSAAETAMDLV